MYSYTSIICVNVELCFVSDSGVFMKALSTPTHVIFPGFIFGYTHGLMHVRGAPAPGVESSNALHSA